MKRQRRILISVISIGALALCAYLVFNRLTVEPDDRPTFALSSTSPFHIEFGRGSGWHGLETVKIDESGSVELCRFAKPNENDTIFEMTRIQLTPAQIGELVEFINSRGILNMGRTYRALGIQDGTQWVLSIKQASHEKSIFFDNSFPGKIEAFADYIDSLLSTAGSASGVWTPVPNAQVRGHQVDLWKSIEH